MGPPEADRLLRRSARISTGSSSTSTSNAGPSRGGPHAHSIIPAGSQSGTTPGNGMVDSSPPLAKKRARKAKASTKDAETAIKRIKVEQLDDEPVVKVGPKDRAVEIKPESTIRQEPKSRTKKVKAEEEDRRTARVRAKCPKNVQDRVNRVMTQRMFMVDREAPIGIGPTEIFKVLGSTGNVYTVTIGPNPTCDCPDCQKGNVPCKHIIFIFLKVLKVPMESHVWYQKGLLSSELKAIFDAAPSADTSSSAVSAKIRNAYLRATGVLPDESETEVGDAVKEDSGPGTKRISAIGEDCPVCFEEMSQEDDDKKLLIYDEGLTGCGKPIHKECFNMWASTAMKNNGKVTCVWCRTPWPVIDESGPAEKGKGKGKAGVEYSSGGYINMADIAGMSRQRDTSTYYWGPRAGVREWESRYSRYEDD